MPICSKTNFLSLQNRKVDDVKDRYEASVLEYYKV